jgi:hypothetical protein
MHSSLPRNDKWKRSAALETLQALACVMQGLLRNTMNAVHLDPIWLLQNITFRATHTIIFKGCRCKRIHLEKHSCDFNFGGHK